MRLDGFERQSVNRTVGGRGPHRRSWPRSCENVLWRKLL